MTAPSSSPRGEHTPRPGITWDTQLVWHGEVLDATGTAAPAGWCEPDTTAPDMNQPQPPRPNRATRRAMARAARRTK